MRTATRGGLVAVVLAIALATLALPARRAAAQDTPGPAQHIETIPAGSLVIPMDSGHQGLTAPFNLRAYGLVNDLLHHKIPVKWAIKAGKAKDAVDFTATATRVAPSALGAASQSFSAGPFIVHAAYASLALARIAAFGGNVAVYQLAQDTPVDVRYTLMFYPEVGVGSSNSTIHTNVLTAAGIADYTVINVAGMSNPCLTLVTEAHAATAATAPVRAYVQAGGNFLAQCVSVNLYENAAGGDFLTTAGIKVHNVNNTLTFPNPDLSFTQFDGPLLPNPAGGGSTADWQLNNGSVLKPGAQVHALNSNLSPATWAATVQKLYNSGPGGLVFYLGGHSYGTTSLSDVNGQRMLLNAVLTPPTRAAGCGLTFGSPDLTIAKTHAGVFYLGGSGAYTVTVTNAGTDTTLAAVTVRDTLPAGMSFASGSGAGWTFATNGAVVTATYAGLVPAGQARAYTLAVNVAPNAAPGVVATRATAATPGDSNGANDVASDPTTLVVPVDVALRKTHAAAFVDRSNGVYTLAALNRGAYPTQGPTVVRDTLPAGLTFVTAAGTGWNFANAGQVVTATYAGTIAAGDSAVFSLIAAASASAVPAVTNAATLSTPSDTSAGNDRALDPTTVLGVPDLTLDKRHTAPFAVTQTGSYTLVVRNLGSAATSGATTVTDSLPAALAYANASGTGWTFANAGGVVTATHAGTIAAGDSAAFTLDVTIAPAAYPSVSNSATVTTPGDADPTNDRDTDAAAVNGIPELTLDKRHTAPFLVGQNGAWTLVVRNVGTAATQGVTVVRDTLPAGFTPAGGGGAGWTFTFSGSIVTANHAGAIAAGDSAKCTILANVPASAFPGVVNSATVSTSVELDLTNDRDTDPTAITGAPELALELRHVTPFQVGQRNSYTIVVHNNGSGATSGSTTVVDTLPAGLTFASAGGLGWNITRNGQVLTAVRAVFLSVADSASFSVSVTPTAAAFPQVVNAAGVTGAGDYDLSNNRAVDVTDVAGAPDLALDKRHTTALAVGQNATYTLVVTNLGTAATSGVTTVTDSLPAGLAFVSGAGAGFAVSTTGNVVTATYAGPLAVGDSAAFTLTVAVGPAAYPGVTNAARAGTPANAATANFRDTDPAAVAGAPDIALIKRHAGSFDVGQNGDYTLLVRNVGTAATTGDVTVTDALPAGLAYVSAAGAGWSVIEAAGTVTATYAAPLAPGDSAAFTLTVTPALAAAPQVVNAATASTPGDPFPGNDSASDPTDVNGEPDLALAKRHAAPLTVGQDATYTLVVTNAGTGPTLGAATVTDSLPAGLTFVSAAGAGWSVSNAAGVVTATYGATIAAGDSAAFTLDVAVAPAAYPNVTNTARVASPGDTVVANDTASDPAAVGAAPDVVLAKRHLGTFTARQPGNYRLVVTNLGIASTAGAVTVTDSLPNGLSYVSAFGAGWNVSAAGGVVTATYAATLATGDSAAFTMSVAVGDAAYPSVVNAAVASVAGDANPANDRGVDTAAVVGLPDLVLAKRHQGTFAGGGQGTYAFAVTNAGGGPTSAVRITVADTLAAGLSFVSASGTGWAITHVGQVVNATNRNVLAAGDSATFTLTVGIDPAVGTSVTNAASVAGGGDVNPANNRAIDIAPVLLVPDLAIDKRHTAPFQVGVPGSWTIVVTNLGGAATTGAATVRDTLPAGFTLTGASGSGWTLGYALGILTARHVGTLAPGDSASFTYTVSVPSSARPGVINSAVASTAGDQNASNDRDVDTTAVGGGPDIALDKRHAGVFVAGGTGIYELVVRNLGAGPTFAPITVTDALPAGLGFVRTTGAGWTSSVAGNVVTMTYAAPLAANAAVIESLFVSVDPSAIPGITNDASASTAGDTNPANDTDSDRTIVVGVADLAIAKTHTGTFAVGTTGDYRITVRNQGNADASNTITVRDTLPAGLTFVAASGAEWSVAASGNVVVATNLAGLIAQADSSSFTITVAVSAPALGGVTNRATVRMTGDGDLTNNTASDPTVVIATDLALSKRHVGTFTTGIPADYALSITNAGTASFAGTATVRDTLPAGLTFTAGAGTGWTFTTAGNVVTAAFVGALAPGDSTVATLTVTPDVAALPQVRNAASLVPVAGDVNAANDRAVDLAPVNGLPDLSLDKSHLGSFAVGGTGTYTFIVRNHGRAATTFPVVVTDSLPAGLTYVSAAGSGWTFAQNAGVVTATHAGSLGTAANAFLSFSLVVRIGATAFPSVTNSAFALSDIDADPSDNGDQDFTVVNGLPDLALTKTHVGSFTEGGTGTYRFVVRNTGQAASSSTITVRDTVPAGLTFGGANIVGPWVITYAGGVVTATSDSPIGSADSSAFTLDFTIGPAAVPSVRNSAVVSMPGDANAANNYSVDVAPVRGIGRLTLAKAALQGQVEIGDAVDYTVTIHNPGDGPVTGVAVTDQLPQGFRFQRGSARRDGRTLADPAGAPGPALRFAFGTIDAGATATLTYRVLTGAGADLGSGTNLAAAAGDGGHGAGSARSNTAAATVRVTGGVFADEGIIAGKITTECDCDSDHVQGAEEVGVPGVRVWLEDGSFAITDVEGKYSFNHVRPRLHVVRIDAATLPDGARLAPLTTRNAGDGLSQFVDLIKGELHRADFVETSHSQAVRDSIVARRLHGEVHDPADPGIGHAGAAAADTTARDVGSLAKRSLLVLGVLDMGADLRGTTSADLGGARDGTGDGYHDASFSSDDGRLFGGARAALFATGTAAHGTRFALRYDSESLPGRRLFRDLQPFEGYEAMGDASVHGWAAQSAGRFYLRVDQGRSYALAGDFTTPQDPARQLGAFTRTLNGAIGHFAYGPLGVGAYGTESHAHQVVDEIRAAGVSGPYTLTRNDGTLGTETVEVLTRDRNQPTRILKTEAMLRFVDYTLEPFTGRLLFRHPIASLDPDLNPVSIRVTYEIEANGAAYKVYGADASWTPLHALALGAAVNRDEDPLAPRALASVNGTLTLRDGVTLTGEYARSDSGGTGIGNGDVGGQAARAELNVHTDRLEARVHGLRVGTGFENPSSGVYAGRQELGAEARAKLLEGTSVFLNALRSQDLVTKGHRDGIETGIAQAIADRFTAEAAYRYANEDAPGAGTAAPVPNRTSSVRGRLTAEIIRRWHASVFGEYEQDLQEAAQKRWAVGADTRMPLHTRLYVRHENIASFAGPFALNTQQEQMNTVVGLTTDGDANHQVFGEYRTRDAFAGREAQAAIGLRNRWTVAPGLRLDGTFERVVLVRGGAGLRNAVGGGIEYTRDPLWNGTGRVEMQSENQVQRWLANAGLTRKLTRDWSGLGATTWLFVPGERRTEARSDVGLAYRQTDRNMWNALARYENKLEEALVPASYRRVSNVVAANANAQPWRPWTLSGQFAGRWTHDDRDGLATATTGQLLGARAQYDLTRLIDLGLAARGLRAGSTQFGLGAEVGFVAYRNLRLAGGYNVFGFRDEELSGADRTDQGPYVRFGLKFDETWLERAAHGGSAAGADSGKPDTSAGGSK